MTNKTMYWIADPEGVYAQVEGADQRDEWTKVRGWTVADEPGPTDQVHVVNENPEIGPGRLPYAAVELHAGLGWSAGPPPEPVDLTKPAEAGQPVAEAPKADTKPTPKADAKS